MKVIYGIGKTKKRFKNAVLAIGVFDGLHVGHQKLIKAAVKRAKQLKGPAIVMTFSPHPVQVLHPSSYLPFIVSLPHRLKLIEQLNVDICVVVKFTKQFARLTAEQFVKKCLIDGLRPKEVFVGEDFRFGWGREGTLSYFTKIGEQHGFKVNSIVPVTSGGKKIGSSRIRRLITHGRLDTAKRHLGCDVSAMGTVMKGDGRGRKLGFPTANIYFQNEVILPVGVYAARVVIGGQSFKAMANIGRRPSFKKRGARVNIEAHIFDFKKDIYGKEITVQFVKKIRNEKVFDSAAKLSAQLKRDEIKSRTILKTL